MDRPRLIAPAYKWAALPRLIAKDPYLAYWNQTIFGNASDYYNRPPVRYFMDGGSGILDNCREIKTRIKGFAYAYRMTKDTKWVNKAWLELQVSIPLCCNRAEVDYKRRMPQETGQLHLAPTMTLNGIPSIFSILRR